MIQKVQDRKKVNGFVFLFAATYMISYITRTNFGAIISEMQAETGISKQLLSMSLTGSFITYGAGQVISGILGDKISPKKLISIGLFATVCMNLLIPLCADPWQMLAVWSVNGFAQSFMWPPIVKIMTELLSEEDYKNGVSKVSWGGSCGTIAVYLLSPVLISLFSWRAVFFFAAAMGLLMILAWNRFAPHVEPKPRQKVQTTKTGKFFFGPVLLGILFAIVLQGMLRDGVTTWMPSYISEVYQLRNEISILSGVILPIFSILCTQAATKLYTKRFQNPISCGGVFFAATAVAALVLRFSAGHFAGVSILMFAILTGCMHGANLMLVCMVPAYFKNTGKVGTVSGVLNAATYVGSAAFTYGVAVLSDALGWDATILIWLGIAAAGTAICLVCSSFWNKYKTNLEFDH